MIRRMKKLWIAGAGVLVLAMIRLAATEDVRNSIQFRDAGRRAGLNGITVCGRQRKTSVVEVNGSGAAFQAGIPKPLFRAAYVPGWDVSANGEKFLFPIAGEETTQSPFTVVLNWTSLLKK